VSRKVSLMTFHGSHNFGSVMQAYALKRTVEDLGNECVIINFRPVAQLDKYSLFPKMYGMKYFAKSAAQLLAHPLARSRTFFQYEEFISKNLTDAPEINYIRDLIAVEGDILLTGSDQVWGYQIPEFIKSKEDIRPAYYYSFANGRKVSYAPSTGTATAAQLSSYANLIQEYSHVSVREKKATSLVSALFGRPVECVLDPTFLVGEDVYQSLIDSDIAGNRASEGYCLIYSLQGLRARKDWQKLVSLIQDDIGLPMISASHFVPLKGVGIKPVFDIGPIDVLALFKNASYVLTDTYHGTLFSIHFDKQFVTFTPNRDDPRIDDITDRLGLANRVARTVEEAVKAAGERIEYGEVARTRSIEIGSSMQYLKSALQG